MTYNDLTATEKLVSSADVYFFWFELNHQQYLIRIWITSDIIGTWHNMRDTTRYLQLICVNHLDKL